MIVYVNGDSHSAGAEAAFPACFAEDDPLYMALGRRPHPINLQASYGCLIANRLGAVLDCDAESASSSERIFRTTRAYLKTNQPDIVVIGWPTFEREEWLHGGIYYQVTAGGTDQLPQELQQQYKHWVIDQSKPDVINNKLIKLHQDIFDLHCELADQNIRHLFFNTYSDFANLENLGIPKFDWQGAFIDPYQPEYTYYNWLLANGFRTVGRGSYHFRANAHKKWAEFLLPHLTKTE